MQQTVCNCVGLHDAHAGSIYICIQQAVTKSVAHTCTLRRHLPWLLQYRQYCCSRTSTGLANLWHAAFTAVPRFVSFARPTSLYCEQHLCIYIYLLCADCIWITVATKYHCSETFVHKSERCEVLTGFLSLGRWSGGAWVNTRTWHWTEHFSLLLKQEAVAAQLLKNFVAYRITRGDLY